MINVERYDLTKKIKNKKNCTSKRHVISVQREMRKR